MIYRNPKLLSLAKLVPHCMNCSNHNYGQVVAAHSNQQRDGKGTAIKAHDYRIAFLCDVCHFLIDSSKELSRELKTEVFEQAHRKSIGWMFDSGHLQVVV